MWDRHFPAGIFMYHFAELDLHLQIPVKPATVVDEGLVY